MNLTGITTNTQYDETDVLPDEMIIKVLFETDDLDTLSRWCQTSRRINIICQDETLWHRKYQKDFGKAALIKGFTWKEQYKFKYIMGGNSPISASGYSGGIGRYGLIDKSGYFYMKRAVSPLVSFSRTLFFKFPLVLRGVNFVQPKIISISIGKPLIGAVTKDGAAYVWNYSTYTPKEIAVNSKSAAIMTINSSSEISLPTKARRIVVSSLGYMILLENSFVYLRVFKKDVINAEGIIKTKIIDMSIGFDMYVVVTENNKLMVGGNVFNKKLNTNNELIPLYFPKPVKRVIATEEYILILSTTGDVYTWEHTKRIFSPGTTIFNNANPKLVILPEPIGQISADGVKFAALSITGKLYMWKGIEQSLSDHGLMKSTHSGLTLRPVNIPFGSPINFVSVAGNFTITIDNKGVINYWSH